MVDPLTQKAALPLPEECALTEVPISLRSLRQQAHPVPPQPDFSQDILHLSPPSEKNNVLSFPRFNTERK